MVVAEQYPQLRATEAFRDLTVQLEGTENRIAVERQRFNEVVQNFNSAIKVFPSNLLAGMYGFKEKAFFAADKGANKAPEVKF
jgi:LemA protein